MNLSLLLREAAAAAPAKPALYVAGRDPVTYAGLDAEADRVASALHEWEVGRGDRVAIAMGNVPHFAFAYFGILRAGAVAVPINPALTETEIARILADAEPKAMFAGAALAAVAQAAASQAGVERVIVTTEWDRLPSRGRIDDEDVSGEDLAVLVYTSGTTGEPKGAMLTHGNLRANLAQQMAVAPDDMGHDDVLLLALPLSHIFGLNVGLGLVALNGASGVLIEQFEPVAVLRAIELYRVTVVFGAPTMYIAFVNTPGAEQYDLSTVKLAVSGASSLAPEVLTRVKEVFGVDVYEGYGLTETAPTLTSNRVAETPRPGSIGKPVPDVEIRLVDEDGNEVELGDPGEIEVRGPNVFAGYWRKEGPTEAAFRDGWFRTGDVAVRDEDGYLYLVDRKRDLIIVSGFNVFPSEVEAALMQNPKVAEAAVVGVPHPYSGEAVKAYVVLVPGASADEDELAAEVQTRLAKFKCPRSIEIVPELPHVPTGKVLRRALRD